MYIYIIFSPHKLTGPKTFHTKQQLPAVCQSLLGHFLQRRPCVNKWLHIGGHAPMQQVFANQLHHAGMWTLIAINSWSFGSTANLKKETDIITASTSTYTILTTSTDAVLLEMAAANGLQRMDINFNGTSAPPMCTHSIEHVFENTAFHPVLASKHFGTVMRHVKIHFKNATAQYYTHANTCPLYIYKKRAHSQT